MTLPYISTPERDRAVERYREDLEKMCKELLVEIELKKKLKTEKKTKSK